jgi:transposase
MYWVGLDVHQRRTAMHILDANGRLFKEAVVIGSWDRLLEELATLPRPMAVCFEASTGCGWLYERILPLAVRVEVAHPGALRLIFKARKKNDRVDAAKLAMLLMMDQVPRAYIPDARVRGWRSLVEFRRRTVEKRTRTKNALRTVVRSCGIQTLPRRQTAWSAKGLEALRQLPLPHAHDRLRRDLLMEELEQYNRQIQCVERQLDDLADAHAGVALLRSMPGVGPRTAEAVVAYIDQPRRFRRNKQVGAYFGLVPCQDASGEVNRLGHITRQGPATVRKLLVEAAWQGIRHSPTLRDYYRRISQGKKTRRRIALVATAHHMLRVMQAMLKSGEVWREDPHPCSQDAQLPVPPEALATAARARR